MKQWFKLQEWVADILREISPHARSTKGSGNSTEKGDIKLNCGLHVECKCYQKKNVWNIDWLKKCEEEIPLHSDKIAIVVTENKENEKIVHLDAEDFFTLYNEYWRLKYDISN
ncbi:MAG: hypothetical protein ACTSXT_08160 [Candidatus Helarchaeota archaeon]